MLALLSKFLMTVKDPSSPERFKYLRLLDYSCLEEE
jgi:hypothetical protein